ncbi:3'-5' exonuclease [Magnetospirillum gryphiswaldense]|uniref:Exonuclease domain-containing protein n=1 Tax=Magnetospirillum gryphiswaldense TaxID=55518 RepID=A4U2X4_9PROT|nr:3'-5' exonuclease [Magnetospirillum gryphiswaldense]AVM75640.1 sporulation inhibitor KapD [Magnetospirillum gryphiswaldense MSR-1]AVM79543.1 sporulation inhibitor KapD [Magnetospirillum gryphiswaldense]CAM77231.1 conserved hypothetical protein [Magnetospirillum gryphiswaldense MSR-1]
MRPVVIYDLEYTSWAGAQARNWSGAGEYREIVQIGAVRLDQDFRELDCLDILVRPRRNPRLSDYFTQLTGISQAMLNESAVEAEGALQRLLDFAAPDLSLLSNGADGTVLAENCALLDCDDLFAGRTGDVHALLLTASGRVRLTSAELPEIFGLPSAGRGHTALADARNVAAALRLIAGRDQSSSKAFL